MSTPPAAVCPSCHAAIAPGSAFCTRCGAATALVTEIAPVLAAGQQWGGSRRRDRRAAGPATVAPGAPAAPGPGDVRAAPAAPALPFPGSGVPAGHSGVVLPHHPALGPAFDGVAPAGVGRRLGAYAVDLAAVLVVAGAVLAVAGPVYAALAGLEVAVGLVVWEARSGRTVGNALLGLRTAKEEAPFAPGLGRAVGRALVLGAGHLTGVGQWLVVASSSFDRSGRGQAWHDRAVGTLVVDVRSLRTDADADAAVTGPVLSGAPVPPVVVSPAAVVPPAAPVPPTPPAPPVPTVPHKVAAPAQPPAPRLPTAPAVAPPVAPPATSPVAPPVVPPVAPVGVPAAAAPVARPVVPPVPSTPAPAAAPRTAPVRAVATHYLLKVDNGQAFTVHGGGLIGRRPQAPPGEAYDHVVEIEDPGRSLSRTHARFGVDSQGFWVEDRGSANGTAVQTDAGWVTCVPGRRTRVAPGAAIRLGDRTLVVDALA